MRTCAVLGSGMSRSIVSKGPLGLETWIERTLFFYLNFNRSFLYYLSLVKALLLHMSAIHFSVVVTLSRVNLEITNLVYLYVCMHA
jgi:hypothetical protein